MNTIKQTTLILVRLALLPIAIPLLILRIIWGYANGAPLGVKFGATNSGINASVINNADGGQIGMGTTQRILKWLGSNITFTGSGAYIHTFPAATDTVSCLGQDETFTGKKTFNTGTSKTTMNNASGAAPTSPVEGDTWNDSTQKSIVRFVDGIKQYGSGILLTQTADKTVANTVTETSIVGTGIGTLTLPANFWVAGKTIRITMSGVYSTVAVTGDTVTIKVKYGSTVLASKATTALVTGGSNLFWESEVLVTCRTTGATGTVQVSGGVRYQVASSVVVEDELNGGIAATTLDTTAGALFDITVTHSAANASNTVKSLVGAFEVLN